MMEMTKKKELKNKERKDEKNEEKKIVDLVK